MISYNGGRGWINGSDVDLNKSSALSQYKAYRAHRGLLFCRESKSN